MRTKDDDSGDDNMGGDDDMAGTRAHGCRNFRSFCLGDLHLKNYNFSFSVSLQQISKT